MQTTNDSSNGDFELRIEFVRSEGDPTRVFRAMTGLIEAAQSLDSHMALSLGVQVTTSLVLENIEAASLKAKLNTIVNSVPDEALKSGEVKKIIGHYLVAAKHKVISWCGGRTQIENRTEVVELQKELHQLAESSDLKVLPAYAQVELRDLVSDIRDIKNALSCLIEADQATYIAELGTVTFNPRLEVPDLVVEEILTKEKIASKGERILKIKKPDYLGNSKWEFKYAGHLVDAKINDVTWLRSFHAGSEPLNPGDSLKAEVSEVASYGYNNEIVGIEYSVERVIEILRGPRLVQGSLLS
jgi:hypothetical protein